MLHYSEMNHLRLALFIALGLFGLGFILIWAKDRKKIRLPNFLELAI